MNQLFIDVDVEDIISTILFLKTNEKCRFRQLIDITAVDYPEKEKRFKIVYLLLSHENNSRIIININVDEKIILKWKDKLSSIKGYKVGINWQGDPKSDPRRLRSIPLNLFETFFSIENLNFISNWKSVLGDVDIIIIGTKWNEYKKLNLSHYKKQIFGKVLLDFTVG